MWLLLGSLEFELISSSETKQTYKIPTFRVDIEREIDIWDSRHCARVQGTRKGDSEP